MNKQESVMISDKVHEECGVFGFYDNDGFDVARLTYYGLYGLQHRGQQSAGIAVNDDNTIKAFVVTDSIGTVAHNKSRKMVLTCEPIGVGNFGGVFDFENITGGAAEAHGGKT